MLAIENHHRAEKGKKEKKNKQGNKVTKKDTIKIKERMKELNRLGSRLE